MSLLSTPLPNGWSQFFCHCSSSANLMLSFGNYYYGDLWLSATDPSAYTANNFRFMYSQKRFSQATFPIINLKLCYSLEKYSPVDAAIQLSAYRKKHVSKWNYEIMYSSTGDSYSRLELQRWPLNLLFPFLKYIFGIWERGLTCTSGIM